MKFVIRAIVALSGFSVASAPALASCPVATFGTVKVALCTQKACGAFAAPREIAEISRGIYSEYIGLFVNDGYARWVGLDLDRVEIVEVQRYAGPRRDAAAKEFSKMKQSASHYRREMKNPKAAAIEIVRKTKADRAALGDVVCAANALWADKPDPALGPQVARMSDSHNKLFLLDRGVAKDFGGPGELTEAPRGLRDKLDALQKSGGRP